MAYKFLFYKNFINASLQCGMQNGAEIFQSMRHRAIEAVNEGMAAMVNDAFNCNDVVSKHNGYCNAEIPNLYPYFAVFALSAVVHGAMHFLGDDRIPVDNDENSTIVDVEESHVMEIDSPSMDDNNGLVGCAGLPMVRNADGSENFRAMISREGIRVLCEEPIETFIDYTVRHSVNTFYPDDWFNGGYCYMLLIKRQHWPSYFRKDEPWLTRAGFKVLESAADRGHLEDTVYVEDTNLRLHFAFAGKKCRTTTVMSVIRNSISYNSGMDDNNIRLGRKDIDILIKNNMNFGRIDNKEIERINAEIVAKLQVWCLESIDRKLVNIQGNGYVSVPWQRDSALEF